MADRVLPGPVESSSCSTGSVNIHTNKIFDCCRDKDCIEDLRVYPTVSSQSLINSAFNIRPVSARLLYANVVVDDISFNRGYYTVDVSFFYQITGTTFPGGSQVTGLAIFDKRVILFGSEGTVKVFSSAESGVPSFPQENELPTAYVEAVDPIALNMKIVENDASAGEPVVHAIPQTVMESIGEELVLSGGARNIYVTLGQFSIIRLERETQLTLDDVKYFFPDKECMGSSASEDDPCALFSKVRFPVEEFFPPDAIGECRDYKSLV